MLKMLKQSLRSSPKDRKYCQTVFLVACTRSLVQPGSERALHTRDSRLDRTEEHKSAVVRAQTSCIDPYDANSSRFVLNNLFLCVLASSQLFISGHHSWNPIRLRSLRYYSCSYPNLQ